MYVMLGVFMVLSLTFFGFSVPGFSAPAVYTADLDGSSQAPPNASTGTGLAKVILDTQAHTLLVEVSFAGLTGNTTVAHIHGPTNLPAQSTAGVITPVPTFPGFPSGVTSGAYSQVFDTSSSSTWNVSFINANGGTPLSAEAALAGYLAETRTYVNIHTTAYGGGEIRGFLVAPVPASLLLLGTGLSVLAGARLRRKKK